MHQNHPVWYCITIVVHAGYSTCSGYALVNSTECEQASSSVGWETADDT
jgi:hypothetical protein